MRLLIISCVFFILIFNHSVSSRTLEDIISQIGIKSQPELKKEIKNLPQEEKLKLQLLLLIYGGENKKAEEILEKLSSNRIISNVIVLPKNLYALVVDETDENLYVIKMENGFPVIVKEFSCITGKKLGDKLREGDQRTPEGIYFPIYWSSNLPSTYGIGAFPLNYPNLLDRKILKRDGYGIWIHGTDNPKRPPHSSDGCIVLKNADLRMLKRFVVPKKTPVVIVSRLTFSPKSKFINEKESLINFIMTWKKSWENTTKNINPYLSCYDQNFVWKGGGINSWMRYKKRVTKKKKWIKIRISNLAAIKDGRVLEFGNLYAVRMILDYKSNNYNNCSYNHGIHYQDLFKFHF